MLNQDNSNSLSVSVVIPAHNAADTIAETIASLLAQTSPNWEAIIINDGSNDDTAAVAAEFAAQDKRIQIVSQPQMGASAARNAGIGLAQFDWLLFLDADDWLLPQHLERMTEAIASSNELDAVHCGWVRITPNGQTIGESYCQQSGDLFPLLACTCAFAIHACIIRKTLVESNGGFDLSLRTCEDWDLWQRIARTGACFGAVPEVLAYYRMRPDSASIDTYQLLEDALRVIAQGHSSDLRVPNSKLAFANGQPTEQLSMAKFYWLCWSAGLALGSGKKINPLLEKLQHDTEPALEPSTIANYIFYAATLPSCQPLCAWHQIWSETEPQLDEFLRLLETQSMTLGLARRTRKILERLVIKHSQTTLPLIVGNTYAVRVEVTQPISDICPPAAIERLYCVVELEGKQLGTLELAVCDQLVAGAVLADAIAKLSS